MDRIFSTRVDESVLAALDRAARLTGTTKKELVEEAIRARVQELEEQFGKDVWSVTAGAWSRSEPPGETVEEARRAFEQGIRRHHRDVRE